MHRRAYLAACGATLVAGCGGAGDGGGQEDSGQDTTAEPTPTTADEPESTDDEPESSDDTAEPSPAEFELVAMEFPDEVALEEEYTPEITIRNVGDQAGTLEAPMYSRIADTEWEETGTWTFTGVAGGATRTEQGADGWHHNYLYEYGYSLGDFEESVTVDTTPFETTLTETYPAPNGVEVTVSEVRLTARYQYQNYDDETVAKEAPDGSQWALVTLRAENTSDSAATLPHTFDLYLVTSKSQYEQIYIDKEDNKYEGGEVQPGIVREGWVAYEIPDTIVDGAVEIVWSGHPNGGDVTAIWSVD